MKKISFLLLIGWIFALTGDELAQQMDSQKTPIDSKVDILMTLTNKKGKPVLLLFVPLIRMMGENRLFGFCPQRMIREYHF